jgi:hypothetical protein
MLKGSAIVGVVFGAVALVGAINAAAPQRSSGSRTQHAVPIPQLPPARAFVRRIDNKYFPLVPGTRFLYRGKQDGEPREVSVLVTRKTKVILGIRAVVVLDQVLVGGKPEEKTFDWYAQDKRGNVWYLGEDSSDFVKGKWVRSDGSWEAGVHGARPGIVMEAKPSVGDAYRQEYYKGHAEDMAAILRLDASVSVPYGTFRKALVTKEWTPLERGVIEQKYYARGVGNVRTVMVKGGSEEERLVSVTRPS